MKTKTQVLIKQAALKKICTLLADGLLSKKAFDVYYDQISKATETTKFEVPVPIKPKAKPAPKQTTPKRELSSMEIIESNWAAYTKKSNLDIFDECVQELRDMVAQEKILAREKKIDDLLQNTEREQ